MFSELFLFPPIFTAFNFSVKSDVSSIQKKRPTCQRQNRLNLGITIFAENPLGFHFDYPNNQSDLSKKYFQKNKNSAELAE